MIYLIITTSINNRFGNKDATERKERYLYAISETLKMVPPSICPIIVENNSDRVTYLDNFVHNGRPVKVLYTTNNSLPFKSKGTNEILDIKEVIHRTNINDDDIVIKLTGRYRLLSPLFLDDVIANCEAHDAFVKFFGTCSLKYEEYDCILGLYALKAKYYKLLNHLTIDNYPSAEIAFARYIRFCGAQFKEVKILDVECCFGEDRRLLIV
jgi:hypothetical protein